MGYVVSIGPLFRSKCRFYLMFTQKSTRRMGIPPLPYSPLQGDRAVRFFNKIKWL